MKKIISNVSRFIKNIINELFILAGIFIVVLQTYKLDEVIGMYLIGFLLFVFGLFLAITRRE